MPKGKNRLSKIKVREISLVDRPANDHALVLLAKSRDGAVSDRITFRPFGFTKARDEEDEADEIAGEDETGEQDDAQAARDELDQIEKSIRQHERCTPQQAFARAANRFPELYKRARNGGAYREPIGRSSV